MGTHLWSLKSNLQKKIMNTPPPKRIKISQIQDSDFREYIKSEYRMQHANGVDYVGAYDEAFNELIAQSSKYISECRSDIVTELMMSYNKEEAKKLARKIGQFYCQDFYKILNEKTDELIEMCDKRFQVDDKEIL